MQIPFNAKSIITQMYNRFAVIPWKDDDARRIWTLKTAEQLAFSDSTNPWGTKKAGKDRPQSKDCVCFEEPFIGWDILNGTTGKLQFSESIDLTGQVFISVRPFNHLGIVNPPPDPPDNNDMEEKLNLILAGQAKLMNELETIKLVGLEIISLLKQDSPVSIRLPVLGNANGIVSGKK